MNTVYDGKGASDGFSGLGDEEVTLTDTTVSASVLKDLYENGTTETIDLVPKYIQLAEQEQQ